MDSAHCRFSAPAKVNFGLRILGRRVDGYHAIQTILQMIDLCDWLTFRANDTGTIQLNCLAPELPMDDNNLIVRAAKLLQQTFQVQSGVDITVDKHIPIAAGLGGGSSDAATTLLVLKRVWGLHCPQSTLHHLAAQLGSDVPFFLDGSTAVASSRGEVLSPVLSPPSLTGVLVNPGFGVSAGWAYGQFNGQSSATDQTIPTILQTLESGDLPLLEHVLINDLERGVALAYPAIHQVRRALRSVGAEVTFMSGSGPTVAGLFSPPVDLSAVVASLRQRSAWTVIPFRTLSEIYHPELRG